MYCALGFRVSIQPKRTAQWCKPVSTTVTITAQVYYYSRATSLPRCGITTMCLHIAPVSALTGTLNLHSAPWVHWQCTLHIQCSISSTIAVYTACLQYPCECTYVLHCTCTCLCQYSYSAHCTCRAQCKVYMQCTLCTGECIHIVIALAECNLSVQCTVGCTDNVHSKCTVNLRANWPGHDTFSVRHTQHMCQCSYLCTALTIWVVHIALLAQVMQTWSAPHAHHVCRQRIAVPKSVFQPQFLSTAMHKWNKILQIAPILEHRNLPSKPLIVRVVTDAWVDGDRLGCFNV